MSRLLLYTDLSPSWPWLFATIHANRPLLAEHGIACAAFAPHTTERIPSHNFYWSPIVKEGAEIPKAVQNRLNALLAQLDAGEDVLLMGSVANPEAQQSLTRLLQNDARFARHPIQLLLRIGKPVCTLEQRFRGWFTPVPTVTALRLVRFIGGIASLVRDLRQQWGAECVSLLPDFSDSCVPIRDTRYVMPLFEWLACPQPRLPEHIPLHHFFLRSWDACRLAWTPEVRRNAWPPLNTGIFMDCLAQAERDWGTDLVSPLKYRQILLHGSEETRALESLLEVGEGSLDCPKWLATQKEITLGQPLPKARLDAFAQALPEKERAVLRQRYSNDAVLLSPAQKLLATALAEKDAVCSHIGEPVPPPTLTVLTMTYNHEKYIAECMDSVLAQKTDFPVRHIVLDHHSQDDTPKIIAAYAAKHPTIHPVLLSCRMPHENVRGLFTRCRSTYASLCDGDDYFTDPLKLQKQVAYLEKNKDCALCAHPVQVVFEDAEYENSVYPPESELPQGFDAKYPIEQLFQLNFIQTNSVVYRWRFTEGLPNWFHAELCPGDWYWHLLHAEMGKIGFMPEVMSVYRRHKKAIYHTAHVSVVEHRRMHGMSELKTYKIVNDHFNGKYFNDLATLANGVLANFLQISLEENDDALLSKAVETFPDFGKYFLESIKKVQGTHNEA